MIFFWAFYSSNNPSKSNMISIKILSSANIFNINNNKIIMILEHQISMVSQNDLWKIMTLKM